MVRSVGQTAASSCSGEGRLHSTTLFGIGESLSCSHTGSDPPSADAEEGRSGWSSRLAVRTGRLRRSLVVHVRPIDLVVFQEPTRINPLETSSRRGLRA